MRLQWKRTDRVWKIYEAEGFAIEAYWALRSEVCVRDGWTAYSDKGPTRKSLGRFDRLSDAKARCEEVAA